MDFNDDDETVLLDEVEGAEDETPPPVEKTEKTEEKKNPEKDDLAAMIRELRDEQKQMRTRITEAETDRRYWYDKANAKAAPPQPEDDLSSLAGEDFVDAFSSNDPKRIAGVLDKLGYAKKGDVERTAQRTRVQVAEEQKFFADFPELRDAKSEMFETATKHYRELVADDPAAANDPRTLKMAAKLAKVELAHRETTEDRNRRVGAQQGSSGRRPASESAGTVDESKDLSPMQKHIVAQMRAAGASITEEDYIKRANKGIAFSGARSRRVAR